MIFQKKENKYVSKYYLVLFFYYIKYVCFGIIIIFQSLNNYL